MIRVGVVNIDTSHPNAFAQKMIDDGRARYVAIYNDGFRGDDEVNGFMEKFGLDKHCKTVEELADILEVVYALAKVRGCSQEELLAVYEKKHAERGGFDNRQLLIESERGN